MKKVLYAGALLAGLCLAVPVAADVPRSCQGDVKGDRGERLNVAIELNAMGHVESTNATWGPPSSDDEPFPMLTIGYPVVDDTLAPPQNAGIGGAIEVSPAELPKSQTAEIVISNGKKTWRRPWQLFEHKMAELRASDGLLEVGSAPIMFWGTVPMAHRGVAARGPEHMDLLTAISEGDALTVRIVGDANEQFWEKRFELSDFASRDRMLGEALARAREASRNPASCKARR